MSMKHLLITRFALRFAEDNPRKRFETPGWIDYRLGLLKKYCVPSIFGQTCQDFDWYILVNRSFPGLTTNHIETLSRFGKVLEVNAPWNECQPEIGELLASKYDKQWICSTRLDSDDMLSTTFIERLKQKVSEKEQWVSFEYGYIIKDGYAALRKYNVNPFLSYVEYANPLKTVFHRAHNVADRSSVPFNLIPEIGWAQVDHGDNIKNHSRSKVRNFDAVKVPVSELRSHFPCI